MTSRERLIAVMRGEIPDRVPVSFFVQEEFLGYYYPGRNKISRLNEAVDCARELKFDLMVRSKDFETPHFLKKSFINWELNSYERIEKGNLYKVFEISTPLGNLKQVEVGPDLKRGGTGIHRTTYEHLIKDERDLEIFSRYLPQLDKETIYEMKEFVTYAKDVVKDTGIFVPWGWSGVYNQAAGYRNIQDLMIDPYIDPEFYTMYMKKIADAEIEYNSVLAGFSPDGIGIQGNIANSGMVGRQFFDEYIFPYEKRLVEAIKQKNVFTVYHNCGKARVLQESYADMGLTAWETVAHEPQGDNSLEEAKRLVGDRLVLVGNLDQVNFLKTAAKKEIEQKVEVMIQTGKPNGRYIFAGSDFLEKDTPVENIVTAVETAKVCGIY